MPEGQIEVTYKCWGCGSEQVAYEPQTETIPSKEVWNICPECQRNIKVTEGLLCTVNLTGR